MLLQPQCLALGMVVRLYCSLDRAAHKRASLQIWLECACLPSADNSCINKVPGVPALSACLTSVHALVLHVCRQQLHQQGSGAAHRHPHHPVPRVHGGARVLSGRAPLG